MEALYGVFPHADLFTLTWDPRRLSPGLAGRRATTSAIHTVARAPFVDGRFRGLLPLFPKAVESFRLDKYSLVVSSSHCVAIGARAPKNALHVAYVHSTMRYTREGQRSYEASVPMGHLGRAVFRGTAGYLRRWETEAATRPHVLIANSSYTRDRIRRYYQRDAQVIEPPIETRRFAYGKSATRRDAPFLVVSALVPNKRVDLALRAFQGRPERLIVVGDGPERARLLPLVGPNVTLRPRVEERELAELFASSAALLHPAVDDFGMVMVEALAAGKPVLAVGEGGALDIVRDGETGYLIDAPTVEAVRAALDRFRAREHAFDASKLREVAGRFDRTHFERRFAEAVDDARRRHGHSQNGASGFATRPSPPSLEAVPRAESLAKRLVDVTLAAGALVGLAPLLGLCGAAIALSSKGPVLFRQQRVGRNDRPFTMVKLRTMDDGGRATLPGRVLRPLGLDELPQLWNVLKGDMSIIGPRPEVPERVAIYKRELEGYCARHAVKPGITGLAQVRGLRGDHSGPIAERLKSDLEYVRDAGLAMDLAILLRTVPRVLVDTFQSLRG